MVYPKCNNFQAYRKKVNAKCFLRILNMHARAYMMHSYHDNTQEVMTIFKDRICILQIIFMSMYVLINHNKVHFD